MAKKNADGCKKAANTKNYGKKKDNTKKPICTEENKKQKNIREEKENRKQKNTGREKENRKQKNTGREKENRKQKNISKENQNRKQKNISKENLNKKQKNIGGENQNRKQKNVNGENQNRKQKNVTGENLNRKKNSSNKANRKKNHNNIKENSSVKNNIQEKTETQKKGNSKKKDTAEKYSDKNRDRQEVQYDTEKKNTSYKKNPTVNKEMLEEDFPANIEKNASGRNQKVNKNPSRSKVDNKLENNTNHKNKATKTNERINPNVSKEPENTEQPQKHWTQLNREYRLRRQGIYEEEQQKGYREIPRQINLPLNGCGFGDEHFLFAGEDGSPKYEDINAPWDDFINWMEKVCKRYKKYKDTTRKGEYFIGQELIVHAARRNIHTIYCYISLNWVGFRDGFLLQKDCPETVIEFVRGILANKMTEKQMWGTVDDRCPGGTVIVFDKAFMPKEGEDTGTIKFEYHPNYIQEKMEKMKRSNGML